MKTLCLFAAMGIFLSPLQSAQTQTEAHNTQKLVSPAEYRYIPKALRAALDARGCRLPQLDNYDAQNPVNAVSGSFAKRGQTDWAALCIVNDRPRVIVVWGGKSGCSNEITAGWPLEQSFAHEPGGGLSLGKATVKEILAFRKFFGDTNTNPVTHEGINVGDEKASLIYYCDGKNWLQLQGDD